MEKFGYTLLSLDPTSQGHSGAMKINRVIDELEGRSRGFSIFNDARSSSGAALANIVNDVWGGNDKVVLGYGPYSIPETGKSGTVYNHPVNTNYTPNDRAGLGLSSDPRLDKVVGLFLGTQVHETGNTMQGITGKYIGSSGIVGGDSDSGAAFEDCVYNKLSAKGFK